MKQMWLYISNQDVETERQQCAEEGRDLASVQAEFEGVLGLDLENPDNQPAAQALLDRTIGLPSRPDYRFHEPSDLAGIRAARPTDRHALPSLTLSSDRLEDKVYGAWAGRCVGCLLGKPVEGWRRDRMWGYLKRLDRWPLNDYFRWDVMPQEMRDEYHPKGSGVPVYADQVDFMPEDDDTNYTTTGLAILKQYGRDFTPEDVAKFWMDNIPILHTCTAERVAYRNLCLLIPPPASASHRNPYREWSGAQIRADFFGYAAPGNPELAAEFAWRDASISHVKNGIYGEMWSAAMIASAFVTDDIGAILNAGLGQIPANCRFADAVRRVIEWRGSGLDYDRAVEKLHEEWDETRAHDWCHTISNAMVVSIALLWGENDYGKTICRAVQACFDTDCNGATAGSVMGAILGRKALPSIWIDHIHDTLKTGVAGYHEVKLAQITQDTMEVIAAVGGRGVRGEE